MSMTRRGGPLVAPSPLDRVEQDYLTQKKQLKQTRIKLDQVCGWKITYTYGNHCLWLVTPSAMYVIRSEQITTVGEITLIPSPNYSTLFRSMEKKNDGLFDDGAFVTNMDCQWCWFQ